MAKGLLVKNDDTVTDDSFEIKISIKDGEIISINWAELARQEHFDYKSHADVIKIVKKYMREAMRFVK
jgi:hypothetical protein